MKSIETVTKLDTEQQMDRVTREGTDAVKA